MEQTTDTKVMSKTRIESFSDNVFSIVLTLLVFSFKLPNVTGPDFNQALYDRLFEMHPYFITYILSFLLISMFWVAHHALFARITYSTPALLWLNNLFLLALAFLPFPTEVLGTYPGTESAAIFFGTAMICTSLSFSLLRYYCDFHARLTDDSLSLEFKRKALRRGLIGASLYIIAIAVSAYSPDITMGMYGLIPFLYVVYSPTEKKTKPAVVAEQVAIKRVK